MKKDESRQMKKDEKTKAKMIGRDDWFRMVDNAFREVLINRAEEKDTESLWNIIKDDYELLKWASTIVTTPTGNNLNGKYIVDYILKNHMEDVAKKTRVRITRAIVDNTDIQQLVANPLLDFRNKDTFLLLLVENPSIRLSKADRDKIAKDIAGDNYASHGFRTYDIRYWILKNPNWSYDEKQSLIKRFWPDPKEFDTFVETLEFNILNDDVNVDNEDFDFCQKYDYTLGELENMYGSREEAERIMAEIDFCRRLRIMMTPEGRKQATLVDHIFKQVNGTINEIGYEPTPIEDEDIVEDDEYVENPTYEIDRNAILFARESYGRLYSLNDLRVVAEDLSSDVANNYFARRIAKDILRDLGYSVFDRDSTYMARCYKSMVNTTIFLDRNLEDEPTPWGKKEAIWFFARQMGLIDKRLIDYIGDMKIFRDKIMPDVFSFISPMSNDGRDEVQAKEMYRTDKGKYLDFMKRAIAIKSQGREEN